jgi:hypothetical protein
VVLIPAGEQFSTDSNGRQMIQRHRNARPSWDLNQTEPIAGNFFPMTSAATLSGPVGSSGSQITLAMVTDRAQGVASLDSGAMHVLLHGRLLQVCHPAAVVILAAVVVLDAFSVLRG